MSGQQRCEPADAAADLGLRQRGVTEQQPGAWLWLRVVGRERIQPDAGGLAYWSNELETGHSSRGTLVANILGSAHTFKGDATYGYVADLLDNKVAVGKLFSIAQGLVYNTGEDSITHGMEIAAAITPASTAQAIALIGVNDGFSLL